MDCANVSKFGHKNGNCLCIIPKTIYLHKAVLLDILLPRRCNFGTRSVFVLAAVLFTIRSYSMSL